jgi:hypothetical protein
VVHAALEPIRRIAREAELPRRAADRDRVELRALEQHVDGRVRDLALLAAHDARDGDRPLGVGDDEIVLREAVFLAVDGDDLLARRRPADDDLLPAHELRVERVKRLAGLEQDVVRDVDDVVDRADAGGLEALDHPRRRRCDPDAEDRAGRVARTQVFGGDLDRERLGDVVRAVELLDRGDADGLAEVDAGLARDAEHREQVRAVRRDFEVEHVAFDRLDPDPGHDEELRQLLR